MRLLLNGAKLETTTRCFGLCQTREHGNTAIISVRLGIGSDDDGLEKREEEKKRQSLIYSVRAL